MKKEVINLVCRVCLRNEEQNYEKWFTLFESCNDSSIATKINGIADVNIREGDGLPDRICPDCLLQLENAVTFKSKCETSNNILNTTVWKQKQNICELSVKVENEQNQPATDNLNSKNTAVSPDTSDIENVESLNMKLEVAIETDCKPLGTKVFCHDCGDEFNSKGDLRLHQKNIHKPDYLTCPSCKRIFKTYKSFNHHRKKPPKACTAVIRAKIEGKGKSRIFHCPDCTYITKDVQSIIYHMPTHIGSAAGTLICDKCPKVFIQHAALMSHKEAVHKEGCIEVACHYCGLIIRGRRKLNAHLKKHTTKEAKVPCSVCKKMFKNRRSLQYHMKRHSGIKAFPCTMCTESFYLQSDLCNHKNKVHLKKKYPCDLCGYVMNTITALKIHKPKHTPTNAVCVTCGTFVENEEKLILHQKLHTERKYPCPMCEKNFFTAKSRAEHVGKKHMTSMAELSKKISK